MAFDFESLKAKAKELTNTGVSKAKELTEISKLKMQNVSEQDDIRRAYMEMGKLYYEQHKDAPEADFAAACAKINESMAKIAYNNERIADIKDAGQLTDEDIDGADDITPEL